MPDVEDAEILFDADNEAAANQEVPLSKPFLGAPCMRLIFYAARCRLAISSRGLGQEDRPESVSLFLWKAHPSRST